MTAPELIRKFNTHFGLDEWPRTYEVDSHTYACACQYIINIAVVDNRMKIFGKGYGDLGIIEIAIGENNGIMFKNVELLLGKDEQWKAQSKN